jgi:cell division protein FtsZ
VIITRPHPSQSGSKRALVAADGIKELSEVVDALVVLPNQRLLSLSGALVLSDAFRLVDDVIVDGIESISELMSQPSLINLDFADVRAVLRVGGGALLGSGVASGDERATEATRAALLHPLWSGVDLGEAKAVLLSIVGNDSLSLVEVEKIASMVCGFCCCLRVTSANYCCLYRLHILLVVMQ